MSQDKSDPQIGAPAEETTCASARLCRGRVDFRWQVLRGVALMEQCARRISVLQCDQRSFNAMLRLTERSAANADDESTVTAVCEAAPV